MWKWGYNCWFVIGVLAEFVEGKSSCILSAMTLITSMTLFKAYSMDLKQVLIHDKLLTFKISLKMYRASRKITKKLLNPWKPLLGAPIQRDDKICGYYVMHYMKEIVEDEDLDVDEKWGVRAGSRDAMAYTTQQLDEVRDEWAKHVMTFPDNCR